MPLFSRQEPFISQQPAKTLSFPNTLLWRAIHKCFGARKDSEPSHESREEPSQAVSSNAENATDAGGGDWINTLLQKVWPYASNAAAEVVRAEIPDLIQATKPKWLGDIEVVRIDLGEQAPTLTGIQVDEIDDDGVAEIRLLADVSIDTDSIDCQLLVKPLPSSLKKSLPSFFKGLLSYVSGTGVTVGLRCFRLHSKVLIMLKPLQATLPVARGAQISLLSPPQVDFHLTLFKGEAGVLNLLKPFIKRTIAAGFSESLTIPEHIAIPLEPSMPDMQKPEGLLEVTVVSASEMPVMDLLGHCDTYVDLWVRSRLRQRTSVIYNDPEPRWPKDQATFQFLVHTRRCQVLTLEVWDRDIAVGDDFIGTSYLPLQDLEPMKQTFIKLPIVNEEEQQRISSYAGATTASGSGDVEPSRLYINVTYIPATLAAKSEINPGVLNLKLQKVTVLEDAARSMFPLKAWPHITNQPHARSPRRKTLHPPARGKSEIVLAPAYDCVWDVLGSPEQVASTSFVLEVTDKSGSTVARSQVPLPQIMQHPVEGLPGTCVAAHQLSVSSSAQHQTAVLHFDLVWNPLLHDRGMTQTAQQEAEQPPFDLQQPPSPSRLQPAAQPSPAPDVQSEERGTQPSSAGQWVSYNE